MFLNMLRISSHIFLAPLLSWSSTGSEICFLIFRCRFMSNRLRSIHRTTHLNLVDHFLCLVLPALIGDAANLVLQRHELVLPRPVGIFQKCFPCSIPKSPLPFSSCLHHDITKIILLSLQPFKQSLLKLDKTKLVQVLELSKEEWRKDRFQSNCEVSAFTSINGLVISWSLAIISCLVRYDESDHGIRIMGSTYSELVFAISSSSRRDLRRLGQPLQASFVTCSVHWTQRAQLRKSHHNEIVQEALAA